MQRLNKEGKWEEFKINSCWNAFDKLEWEKVTKKLKERPDWDRIKQMRIGVKEH